MLRSSRRRHGHMVAGLRWARLRLAGLGMTGLDWAGLDWVPLGWGPTGLVPHAVCSRSERQRGVRVDEDRVPVTGTTGPSGLRLLEQARQPTGSYVLKRPECRAARS